MSMSVVCEVLRAGTIPLLFQYHIQPTVSTSIHLVLTELNWIRSDVEESYGNSSSSQIRCWLEWPKQDSLQDVPNRLGITHSQEDSFPFLEVRRSLYHFLTEVVTLLMMFFLVFNRLHIKWPRGKTHCPLWKWVHYLQGKWRFQQHIVPLPLRKAENVCWWWHQKSVSGFWWSWGRTGKRVSEKHVYSNRYSLSSYCFLPLL